MLQNKEAYLNGVWNYDFINEQLPRKLAVSDIDGSLERKGNFLFIETKASGADIPYGQYRLYEQLCYTGVASVLFVFGETDEPSYYRKMTMDRFGVVCLSEARITNTDHFGRLVRSWYDWANKNPTKHYEKSVKVAKN